MMLAGIAVGISTALLAFHLLSGDNWVTFNIAQLGLFFSANTAGKIWGKVDGSSSASPSE